jgi:WD40 repeat protein
MVVSGDNIALFTAHGFSHGGSPPSDGCISSAGWAFSPNGAWAAGTHYGRAVHVRDAQSFELLHVLPASNCAGAVAFSPDGSKLATASRELFETERWTRLWGPPAGGTRSGSADSIEMGVAFSPDAQEVTTTHCPMHNTGCRATRYRALDGSTIADVPELDGERVRYSPDGHWLVSKGRLFHIPTGTLSSYAEDAEVAAFTPDGDLIAGARDGSLARYCRDTSASK